jgi:hypothetical protein
VNASEMLSRYGSTGRLTLLVPVPFDVDQEGVCYASRISSVTHVLARLLSHDISFFVDLIGS